MEVERDIDNIVADRLLAQSKKRSYELFLRNSSTRSPEDVNAQKALLAAKLVSDYDAVRHMAPPQKRQATTAAKSAASATSNASGNGTVIKGGNAVPSGPGIGLTIEDIAQHEEEESAQVSALIRSIDPKNAQSTSSIVEYRGSAGIEERFKALAPIRRRGLNLEKPQWHCPWKLMRVISGHLGWVRAVAVEPGNEWFVTGSADRTIKIWDLASGTLKLTLTGHINTPRALAVSHRHPYLFSGGEDKMVKCWDLEYNKVIRNYHGHLSAVYTMALHPTLDVLITGGRDATARVWDIRTKAQVHVLSSHTATVASLLTQGSDPQVVSGGMDNTIKFWDLAAGRCSATLTNHKKAIRAMAAHPTEFTFASASTDNIKKWLFPEGKFLLNFGGEGSAGSGESNAAGSTTSSEELQAKSHQRSILHSCAVNGDNVFVTGGDNGSLCFWDWNTGYHFQRIFSKVQPGSLECEGAIFAMAFDQSGTRLITTEADKTIKIWCEDPEATEESHPVVWQPNRVIRRW